MTDACGISTATGGLPDPALDAPLAKKHETVVFAGGCFWGIQAVFQHTKGVIEAISGYAGGDPKMANYDDVCTGRSGHAEGVRITYDTSQVSLGTLLKVFFSVAHDPTELNRQGPDTGTQYRSEIFFTTPEQQKIINAYIAQLQSCDVFDKPIVTKVTALPEFFPAEAYHQDYATKHPTNPYIATHDMPKLEDLKKFFPDLYK